MKKEKTFTVVGTAVNPCGTLKVRYANDLVARLKILINANCTDIDLIELPKGMTKLAAAQYYMENKKLTGIQAEAVSLKINEKTRKAKRLVVKSTLIKNVKSTSKKKPNPKVEKFIEQTLKENS